ncbi:MAG: DEAD/DEAH box helicase [Xanthomonadales bacterium]|jgi:ATP-dependent RNA helicase RhlE|nr:DEAD/DEAH box helicase [Xanthomonadales bacterium]
MSFESLGLRAELLRAISEQGYDTPTPIQAQAIPAVLAGRDLMAGAQTGTGKTAGFTLPLLQRLADEPRTKGRGQVRVLILAPTRELAAQVHDSVLAYGKHLRLRSAVIFGGVNIRPQMKKLGNGVDVLVACPGRLLDHANQGTVDLSQVETLVLDEADRMLDMGFIHDIRRIVKLIPAKESRQTLMFSATFSRDIKTLASSLLDDPESIEAPGTNRTADRIAQRIIAVDKSRKRELLSHLIGANRWEQVLVFSRTKHGANRLAKQLTADGLEAAAIHGNKSQGARTRALADFKAGKVRILVATDIAARGLDIEQLPHVINFDLPQVAEDYVHRIGRTGRAGHEGEALSLVSADERPLLRAIERLVGQDLTPEILEDYRPSKAAEQEARRAEKGQAKPKPKGGRPGRHARRRRQAQKSGQGGNPAARQQPATRKRRGRGARQQNGGGSSLADRILGSD